MWATSREQGGREGVELRGGQRSQDQVERTRARRVEYDAPYQSSFKPNCT